jgi:DNA polymerase-3 subunit epsilon
MIHQARKETMRQVAIAFATTGPSPKQGHRISELVAVENLDGDAKGRSIHLQFKVDEAQDKQTFSMQFDTLNEFIGDATIVLHDAGRWRGFLRVELRSIRKRGARRLLTQTLDVSRWARSRYPKSRKSVEAIARKCGVSAPAEMTGLFLEAEQLRLIAPLLSREPMQAATPVVPDPTPAIERSEPAPPPEPNWIQRVQRFCLGLVRGSETQRK